MQKYARWRKSLLWGWFGVRGRGSLPGFDRELFIKMFFQGQLILCWIGVFVCLFYIKHKCLISTHCGRDFCQFPLCSLLIALPGLGSPRAVPARDFLSIPLQFGRATSLCRTGATLWSRSFPFVKQQKAHPSDTAKAFLSWTFWL